MTQNLAEELIASLRERDALKAEVVRLRALLTRIEPHLDAIVCYASTMGEHEPNRLAFDVRQALGEQP